MKKHRRAVTFFKQRSYLLAAVLMLAAVFGMTGVYVSEQRGEKKQQEQLAAKEQQEQLAAREQQEQEEQEKLAAKQREEESTAVDRVIPPENSDFLDEPDVISSREDADSEGKADGENTGDEAKSKESAPGQQQEESAQETAAEQLQPELQFEAAEMGWPLQGNVIMNYSMDQTVYFATLDQYKYNPALIIQGNVNDKVTAVADGKISNIETNEVTGCTVTVDLGDGYSAVYGQLKEVPLSAGDYMQAGDTVGYVNVPTKYYSVEGPNLYFQMIKDNTSVDPMEFLQ